jgi:hypothetical protein
MCVVVLIVVAPLLVFACLCLVSWSGCLAQPTCSHPHLSGFLCWLCALFPCWRLVLHRVFQPGLGIDLEGLASARLSRLLLVSTGVTGGIAPGGVSVVCHHEVCLQKPNALVWRRVTLSGSCAPRVNSYLSIYLEFVCRAQVGA